MLLGHTLQSGTRRQVPSPTRHGFCASSTATCHPGKTVTLPDGLGATGNHPGKNPSLPHKCATSGKLTSVDV